MDNKKQDIDLLTVQKWMKEASVFLKVNPRDLEWNDFRKYLSSIDNPVNNLLSSKIKNLGGFSNIKVVTFRTQENCRKFKNKETF